MSLWKQPLFANRREAGERLAKQLSCLAGKDVVVVAMVRGGVPVAVEIARMLDAPLLPAIVQKIGVPGQPELAMGAIVDAAVPEVFWNEDIVHAFCASSAGLRRALADARDQLAERRRHYTGTPAPPIAGRTVIVVDDGIATGASMQAVLRALRKQEPGELILAVPVILGGARSDAERLADRVICLERPTDLDSVGQAYGDFGQVSHAEARRALTGAMQKK